MSTPKALYYKISNPNEIVEIVNSEDNNIISFRDTKTGHVAKMTSQDFKLYYKKRNTEKQELNEETESPTSSKRNQQPQREIFTFEFSEDGNLTIMKDGHIVDKLSVRGKQGVQGPEGVGLQGPEGPEGKNGKTWRPVFSKDGKHLRFEAEGETPTEWYPVIGPTGDEGKSAYTLWKERQPFPENCTIEMFWDYLKGKNGQNGDDGASAFEVWANSHKEEGKEKTEEDFFNDIASRVRTQKGTTFIPEFTSEGKLYFRNSETGETTTEHEINGHTFVPHFDGTVLYFVDEKGNPQTTKVDLRGHDGRTYKPVWEGNTLYFQTEEGDKTEAKNLLGKDGASAFEVWEKLHKEDGEKKTEEDFFNDIASRVKTQDGTTWIPEITPDGQLYFKNSKTNESTRPQPIKGADGKTFSPQWNGTTLYFVDENGQEVGPRIDLKGDTGRTFKPKWDGNTLRFVAEDGEKIEINASDLHGKDAFELWKEKHHKPNATYEEYEEFFKGQNVKSEYNYEDIKDAEVPIQKIDRNLITDSDLTDGLQSEEYYHYRQQRIEAIREEGRAMRGNWFQEIFWWCAGADTSVLRTCSADHSKYVGIGTVIFFTALMAFFSCFIAMQLVFGEYAKQEMPIGIVTAIPLGILALVVFFHYGLQRKIVKTTIIDKFEKEEKSKEPNQREDNNERKLKERKTTREPFIKVKWGALVIAILIIAIAIKICCLPTTINKTDGIALIVAMFWAAMIFFLDRFITNTMYSDGKTTVSWLEFRSALPRILISIFLGIVISAPLELKIFDSEIEEYIKISRLSLIDEEIKKSDEFKTVLSRKDFLKEKRDNAYKEWQNISPDEKRFIKDVELTSTIPTSSKKNKETGLTDRIMGTTRENKERTDTVAYNKAKREGERKFNECDVLYMKYEKDTVRATYDTLKSKLEIIYNDVSSAGLYERLTAMHNVAMKKGKPDGYKPLFVKVEGITQKDSLPEVFGNNKVRDANLQFVQQQGLDSIARKKDSMYIFTRADRNKSMATTSSEGNTVKDNDFQMTETCWRWFVFLVCSVLFACLVAASIVSRKTKKPERWKLFWLRSMPIILVISALISLTVDILYYILWYITTPIGLIMLLFILIDVSPVFYKMMLADGKYDKILHQDKLLEQDLIRLQVAKSLHKINESELSNLSPFIFGSTYDKVKDMLGNKIEKDKNGKPKKAFDFYEPGGLSSEVINKNNKLFSEVLDMKYRIAWASYAAWYRDMRDHILGKKDDEEGKEINPENIDKYEPGFGTGEE